MTETKFSLSIDGVKSVAGGFKEVGDRVGDLSSKLAGLTTIGGAMSIAAFASIIKGSADAAAGLYDLSIRTGATVEALSGLAEIGKYSDIAADQIAGAMNKLAKNMAGATEESKGTGKALEALGIDFDSFKNLRPEEQMRTVAEAMGKFEDGTGKSAVAMALYGKEGAALLPFMKDLAVAGDLQAKITTAQSEASDNFGDNLTRLQASAGAWKTELAMGMIPVLDTTVQAFVDVTSEAGGLRESIHNLSTDGTIATWTRNAITGVTYVMDAFSGLKRVVSSVGNVIGAYAAGFVTTLGTVGEVAARLKNGDFAGAWNAAGDGVTRLKSIVSELGNTLDETWSEQTLGQQLRARMQEISAVGAAAKETKQNLNFANNNGGKDGKDGKAAKEAQSEYDKLIGSIREKIALQDLEAQSEEKLTEGEKLAGKVMVELRDNKLKLVATSKMSVEQQKIAIAKGLEELITSEKTNAARKEEAKATLAAAEARTKHVATLYDGLDKLKEDVRAQREHNDQIGMSKSQLADLAAAKLEDQATTLDGLAIKKLDKDLDEVQYEIYRAQAKELRELARLKRDGGVKEEIAEEAKQAQSEWAKFNDSVYNGLTDSLFRGFESGKGFFKTFWDGIRNTFKTSVLKLGIQGVMTGITGGLTSGAAQAASAAGAGGSAISGLSSISSVANLGTTVAGGALTFGQGVSAGFAQLTAGVSPISAAASAVDVAANSISTAMGQVAGYLGPIAIAAALLAKGLSYKTVGSGFEGSVAGDEFTGNAYEFRKSTLRGSKTNRSEMPREITSLFQGAVESVQAGFEQLGKATGVGTDLLDGFNYSFRVALADFDEEGKKKEIQRLVSSMSDSMAIAFVDAFRSSVDTAEQAASRYFTNTSDGQRSFEGGVVSQQRVSSPLDPYIDDMLRIFDGFKASVAGVEGAEGKLSGFVTQLFGLGDALVENKGYLKQFGEALDFDKLEAAALKGESVMDTFARLSAVFSASDAVAQALGKNVDAAFGAVGLSSTAARQRLVELAGGLDSLAGKTAFFYENFVPEEKRMQTAKKQVQERLNELGYWGVTTVEKFREEVEKLDLASEPGAKMYSSLLDLAPAFLKVADAAEQTTQVVNNSAKSLEAQERSETKRAKQMAQAAAEQARQESIQAAKDASDSLFKRIQDGIKSIDDWLKGTLFDDKSTLNPELQIETAKQQFMDTYMRAANRDAAAVEALPQIASQLRDLGREFYASSPAYVSLERTIRDSLQSLAPQLSKTDEDLAYERMRSGIRAIATGVGDEIFTFEQAGQAVEEKRRGFSQFGAADFGIGNYYKSSLSERGRELFDRFVETEGVGDVYQVYDSTAAFRGMFSQGRFGSDIVAEVRALRTDAARQAEAANTIAAQAAIDNATQLQQMREKIASLETQLALRG